MAAILIIKSEATEPNSFYFGPFASKETARQWAKKHYPDAYSAIPQTLIGTAN